MSTTREIGGELIYEAMFTREGFEINKEMVPRFLDLCDLADLLYDEFDGEGDILLQIDAGDTSGIVAVDIPDLLLEKGITHPFFTHIKSADVLRFSKENDLLRIQFGIKDLWVKL